MFNLSIWLLERVSVNAWMEWKSISHSCTVSFVLSGLQIQLNDYNRGTYGVNSTHMASKETVNHTQLQMVRSG